jgi:hypothetical protein
MSCQDRDAEIEVRQLYELDDFGPSEAIDRFRDLEAGRREAGKP